jgi:hypothetical protein
MTSCTLLPAVAMSSSSRVLRAMSSLLCMAGAALAQHLCWLPQPTQQ